MHQQPGKTWIVDLVHLAAGAANGESGAVVSRVAAMAAHDKGVEAFEPMHQTKPHQLVEGAIDLQRRAQPVAAQDVEQIVGAERLFGILERMKDQRLVLGQFRRSDGIVLHSQANLPRRSRMIAD